MTLLFWNLQNQYEYSDVLKRGKATFLGKATYMGTSALPILVKSVPRAVLVSFNGPEKQWPNGRPKNKKPLKGLI
ncbi:MAG: hypothetical protein JJ885_09465 [Muricauda sp.]|jgi:hypothetical protein|nr:hypothetical protein [Allomuricauda sp.]MBO6531937.1 hypothetical protein [Allomuricauda sp.]MBO6588598.1 hypothetical protein [Allomuricauda sp.]MBO6618263.1 hypothetical protein [Allomuricauda sp.]MBO6644136.1 hypothetical protein [Allomuricauda sp.]MBO6747020.1 hypothetical protein [Allomuricauda sp.]